MDVITIDDDDDVGLANPHHPHPHKKRSYSDAFEDASSHEDNDEDDHVSKWHRQFKVEEEDEPAPIPLCYAQCVPLEMWQVILADPSDPTMPLWNMLGPLSLACSWLRTVCAETIEMTHRRHEAKARAWPRVLLSFYELLARTEDDIERLIARYRLPVWRFHMEEAREAHERSLSVRDVHEEVGDEARALLAKLGPVPHRRILASLLRTEHELQVRLRGTMPPRLLGDACPWRFMLLFALRHDPTLLLPWHFYWSLAEDKVMNHNESTSPTLNYMRSLFQRIALRPRILTEDGESSNSIDEKPARLHLARLLVVGRGFMREQGPLPLTYDTWHRWASRFERPSANVAYMPLMNETLMDKFARVSQ